MKSQPTARATRPHQPLCLGLVITPRRGEIDRLLTALLHDDELANAMTFGQPSKTKIPAVLETQVGDDESLLARIRNHMCVTHVDVVYADSSEHCDRHDQS